MADIWQQEATDGILVFVSPRVHHSCYTLINLNDIDRSIFCRCRSIAHLFRPGPQTKFSRHLRVLSCEHLSGSRQPKRHGTTYIDPFHHCYTTPVLSIEICYLGEFTLVLELCDQSYMCTLGGDATPMGTSIHQGHSAGIAQNREA